MEFLLQDLPELAILHVASFLSFQDVNSLVKTCCRLHSILPKYSRVVFKGKNFNKHGPRDGHWCPEHYFDGPLLTSRDVYRLRVASLKMSMKWLDQGYGNRKGEIFIQLVRGDEVVAESRDTFGVAGHKEEAVEADISMNQVVTMARRGDRFRFMRNVGGGGGHSLTVKDFTVRMVTVKQKKDEESTD